MKDRLTPPQSQRLIELGVDPSKASMCMLYFPESDSSEPLESWQMWEERGKLLCNPDESQVQDVECVIVPKDADYDQSAKEEHSIFTLSDVLSLLPKRIDNLILSIFGTGFDELTEETKEGWMASYVTEFMEVESKNTIFQSPELIDALYELLCWVLQNHPDKIKKS